MDDAQSPRTRFLTTWNSLYPEAPPIGHLFKQHLSKRWARVRSLHNGLHSPRSQADWDELLQRQNQVIDSLVEHGASIDFVINSIEIDCYLFKSFNLKNVGVFIDAAGETTFQSFIFHTTWERNTLNPVLMMIAHGELRAFIMGRDCLIAPDVGGIDIILKDPHTCWAFKRQFQGWISKPTDGL